MNKTEVVMGKSLKVFLACFIGAGIGTLTALEINGYFWWLGLLVGGFAGYLSYEFKKVLQAIPKAWRAVSSWRPKWRNFLAIFIAGMTIILYPIALLAITCVIVGAKDNLLGFAFVGSMFTAVIVLMSISAVFDKKEMSKEDRGRYKSIWKYNVVYVCFYHLPIWTVKGIIYVVPRTPKFIWKAIVVLARFIKTLFIMIHSEIRLLCGVDAAIGAVIGYLAGNVIVGALAGGLFGVLNYEILSKRVLKLVKNNNS